MDRYKIINCGVQEEWLPGCPVRIEKYNILLDNVTSNNVLQVKYKNISNKTIKSMWICVDGYDDAMDKTVELYDVAYLNLNTPVRNNFGSNIPIDLNSKTTVNVKIIIKKVVFEDSSVWRNEEKSIGIKIPILKAKDIYGDLYDQFAVEMQKIHMPVENAFIDNPDYWICPCGQVNRKNTEVCCNCTTKHSDLQAITDTQYLNQAKAERLKEEHERNERIKAEREKAEQLRLEEEKAKQIAAAEEAERIRIRNEKRKHKIVVSVKAVLVICILCIGIYTTNKLIKYINTEKLVENGAYAAAIQNYMALDGFLDSHEKILETKYLYAKNLAETKDIKNLISAAQIFSELGEYNDSNQKLIETYYNIASIEYNNGNYTNAAEYYRLCNNYNNSADMKKSSENQITLEKAIKAYNSGNYEKALKNAITIPYVKSTKDGVANANEIAEWSKQKLYEQITSDKPDDMDMLDYKHMIENLELLSSLNYKDTPQRLQNIKNIFDTISGHYFYYDDTSDFFNREWTINADYKTNQIDATLSYNDDFSLDFTGKWFSSGGTYGSFKLYDSLPDSDVIYFYDGYLYYDGDYTSGNHTYIKE